MKTDAERGTDGRWLVRSRQERGLTQAEARRSLADAGIEIAASVYAEYEAGSKPISRRHRPLLEGYWGSAAPDPFPSQSDMAEALARIAAEIRELRLALAGEALDPENQRWAAEQRAAGMKTPAPKQTRPRQRPARSEAPQ